MIERDQAGHGVGVDPEKIETDFWLKPIPDRRYDWTATRESYDGGDPIGHGATEQGAINDLKENEND